MEGGLARALHGPRRRRGGGRAAAASRGATSATAATAARELGLAWNVKEGRPSGCGVVISKQTKLKLRVPCVCMNVICENALQCVCMYDPRYSGRVYCIDQCVHYTAETLAQVHTTPTHKPHFLNTCPSSTHASCSRLVTVYVSRLARCCRTEENPGPGR